MVATQDAAKDASWSALAFSRDGRRLATVSAYPDHWLDVWDVDEVLGDAQVRSLPPAPPTPALGACIIRRSMRPSK